MNDQEDRQLVERTHENIEEILKFAKLKKEDLVPTTQCIYFSQEIDKQANYKFLELNAKLEENLKIGDQLYINGESDDFIVLCTEDTTYEVLLTETSNSLLVIKDMQPFEEINLQTDESNIKKVEIEAVFSEYLAPIQCKPNFQKLRKLLEKTAYRGPEHEYEFRSEVLYSLEELWVENQTSKKELKAHLMKLQAITLDGKVRLLDFEYHFRVLSYMLKLIDENSWELDEIDYETTMASLSDIVPSPILNAVFDIYANESKLVDGMQLYEYSQEKVCTFFAQVLLFAAGKFNLREFLQAWQESVPEGMQTNEEMLYSIAIIDRKSTPNVIWSFPEDKLPMDINERFKILFEMKEKWTVKEIAPYIECLTTDKLDVNALLTKHARSSKVDGVKNFSSKHLK